MWKGFKEVPSTRNSEPVIPNLRVGLGTGSQQEKTRYFYYTKLCLIRQHSIVYHFTSEVSL